MHRSQPALSCTAGYSWRKAAWPAPAAQSLGFRGSHGRSDPAGALPLCSELPHAAGSAARVPALGRPGSSSGRSPVLPRPQVAGGEARAAPGAAPPAPAPVDPSALAMSSSLRPLAAASASQGSGGRCGALPIRRTVQRLRLTNTSTLRSSLAGRQRQLPLMPKSAASGLAAVLP